MLRLLNSEKVFVRRLSKIKDRHIESDLSNGDKTLYFTYYGKQTDILNEYYVETETDRYVVKEARPGNDSTDYVCKLDLEDLEASMFYQFTAASRTVAQAAALALEGTGWTVSVSGDLGDKVRSIQQFKKTPYEILMKIRDAFMCEIRFDTIYKVVYFATEFGEDRGVYLRPELNLRNLSLTVDSYDYYTRLIPIGKDGLTIESVNDGKMYVENYQYTSKVRSLIWEDSNYEDPEELKTDAIGKLNDLSKPKRSYSATVRDLAKVSKKYKALEFHLGDTIYLVDEPKGVKEKQRIVRLTEYPDNPEENKVEISNTVLTWEELQDRLQAAADAWEDVTNSDGTVNGVYVYGISDGNKVIIQTEINQNPTVIANTEQIGTVSDNLDVVSEKVDQSIKNVVVMYALSTSPTVAPESGWSIEAPEWEDGKYMWQKTVKTYTTGTVSESDVTCISGATGQTGASGTSVTVSKTEYQAGTSSTTAPTGTWSSSPVSVAEGSYLWTKVTYSDNKVAYSVAKQGKSGTNGTSVTVRSTEYAYQLSTSGTTVPTGSWSTTPVAPTTTQYAWTRTTTTFSDNSTAVTYTVGGKTGTNGSRGATWYAGTAITGTSTTATTFPNSGISSAIVGDHYLNTSTQNVYVCKKAGNASTATWAYEQNIKGEQGTPGGTGADGKTAYFHVKYSNDGGHSFTGNSGEVKGSWIGTYSDNTQADSMNVGDYTWVKIEGDDGISPTVTTSKTGKVTTVTFTDATGTKQATLNDGEDGTSVTVSKTEYQAGTSNTTAPTGTWSTSPVSVAEGSYLWTKVTYSDNKVAYSVAKQGKSGTNGTSVTVKSTEYAYQLSTSGTTVPTGTWSTTPVAPTTTQYAWTRTTTTFSDNSTAVTYTVGGKTGADGKDGEGIIGLNRALGTGTPLVKDNMSTGTVGMYRYDGYKLDMTLAEMGLQTSDYLTLSFDYVAENISDDEKSSIKAGFNASPNLVFETKKIGKSYILDSDGNVVLDNTGAKIWDSNSGLTGHYVSTIQVTEAIRSSTADKLSFQATISNTSKASITISNCKLEIGNKATTWCLAYLDLTEAMDNARSSADGKNKVFYQDREPSALNRKLNDIWFDTDDGNAMYYWNGSNWVKKEFGGDAIEADSIMARHIVAGAITTAAIAAGAITAEQLQADSVTADAIAAGSITGSKLDVADILANTAIIDQIFATDITATGTITGAELISGLLRSSDYEAGTAPYSSVGMKIDLTAQTIQTPKFAVDSAGNIYAKGGLIGGWSIDGGSIHTTSGDYKLHVVSDPNNHDFLCVAYHPNGATVAESWPFWVHKDGELHAEYGSIAGWNFTTAGFEKDGNALRPGSVTLTYDSALYNWHMFMASSGADGSEEEGSALVFGVETKSSGSWAHPIAFYSDGNIWTNGRLGLSRKAGSYLQAYQGAASIWIPGIAANTSFTAASCVRSYNGRWISGANNSDNRYLLAYAWESTISGGNNRNDAVFSFATNGTFTCTQVTQTSDIRLKENIKDTVVRALDDISGMTLRQFDWKSDGRHVDIGFIADELERINPSLVVGGGYDCNGEMIIKSIDTMKLLSYAIKAIQELNEKIKVLERSRV